MFIYDLTQKADRVALGIIATLDGLKEAKERQIKKDKSLSPAVAAEAWNQDTAEWGKRHCDIAVWL